MEREREQARRPTSIPQVRGSPDSRPARHRREVPPDVFLYIEGFYNRRRRHSSLDYLSPEACEQHYYQRHDFA